MSNKSFEWSMGNGQCPACYGLGPVFDGHPANEPTGHELDCELAILMDKAGEYPLFKSDGAVSVVLGLGSLQL